MVNYSHNLAVKNPDLAKEWHPTINGELSPNDVTPGSNKKVWWRCERGHEWEAAIGNRTRGTGCPYCSGRRAGADNNLAVQNPDLAKDWHPSKNRDVSPYDVKPGSDKKVWWICERGHEWKAVISSRTRGNRCPHCSRQKAGADNNLAVKSPALAQEWHPTKNGALTPHELTPGSDKKVWWRCERGHEWEAAIGNRTRGTGCPYCSGRRAGADNNLAVTTPNVAKDWHQTKNGELTPYDVVAGSNKKAWWQCERGHEWEAVIRNRIARHLCPYCLGRRVSADNNLAVKVPNLAKEWHAAKNGHLTPFDVTRGSGRKAWWLCKRGHAWQAIIYNRTHGNGCPYCSNRRVGADNNLAKKYPDLSNQWHPTRNGSLMPSGVTPGSDKKVWWVCGRGHEWKARIGNRARGSDCPMCRPTKSNGKR